MKKHEYIQLISGHQINIKYPDSPGIEDIAYSLARLPRWGGHTKTPYSVASHCVQVSYLALRIQQLLMIDPTTSKHDMRLAGLLHDATEAVLGDVASPIKQRLRGYRRMESRLWRVIAEKYCIPYRIPEAVHIADDLCKVMEAKTLLTRVPKWVGELEAKLKAKSYGILYPAVEQFDWKFPVMDSVVHEKEYIDRFTEITK